MNNKIENHWKKELVFSQSFNEYSECVKELLSQAKEILISPEDTPVGFDVCLGAIREDTFCIRRNLFSTLFQSVYYILDINKPRRLLYAKLNHLFRLWVTSADNLLDNEDKVVFPIEICGSSHIMRQVISIMLGDRILAGIMFESVSNGVLSSIQADMIIKKSLQILLPSAAEEASEEGGIRNHPEPAYILNTIHKLKTGLLFHIPFLGPDNIEQDLDIVKLSLCKNGLMKFGLGCQILDDIRDISKDYLELRHNYILSLIHHQFPEYSEKLNCLGTQIEISSNIFEQFPKAVLPAKEKAMSLMTDGLNLLNRAGLNINSSVIPMLCMTIFNTLEVGEVFKIA